MSVFVLPASPETLDVSVLMCVHNDRPEILDMAMMSLVSQTLRSLEIVLVDDGSTAAATQASLARWAAADRRVRLFREPFRGLTRALNVGLHYCRAEYIARHDADDWSEPTRLSIQKSWLEANPDAGLVGTQAALHMENGRVLWCTSLPEAHNDVIAAFPTSNPFCHGAAMFRRSIALRVGGYRELLSYSQDYDFFWRMTDHARAANLPQVLYHHRRSSGSISAMRAGEQAYVTVLTRLLARMRAQGGENVAAAEAEAKRVMAPVDLERLAARKHADNLLLAGHFNQAIGAFLTLLTRYPRDPTCYAALARGAVFILIPPARPRLFRA